jgi:hypothetical protein
MSDFDYHHGQDLILDSVQNAEVTNPVSPYVAAGELACAVRPRLPGQRPDGGTNTAVVIGISDSP